MIEMLEEGCVNSLGMNITVWKVQKDGVTIGEFRDEKYANIFKLAVARLESYDKDA